MYLQETLQAGTGGVCFLPTVRKVYYVLEESKSKVLLMVANLGKEDAKRIVEWKEKTQRISSFIHILFGYLQKYALKILSYRKHLPKTLPYLFFHLLMHKKEKKAPRKIIHSCKWQETLSH